MEQPSEFFDGFSSGGHKGDRLEPNLPLLPENEDFLLLIKDLLDAVEAMEKSDNRADSY